MIYQLALLIVRLAPAERSFGSHSTDKMLGDTVFSHIVTQSSNFMLLFLKYVLKESTKYW